VAIAACYILAGGLLLTLQPWAALLAIALLVADILGRIALVVAGLYPLDSLEQVVGIVGGTLLAGVFALYVGAEWAASRGFGSRAFERVGAREAEREEASCGRLPPPPP